MMPEITEGGPIAYNAHGWYRIERAMELAIKGYRVGVGEVTDEMKAKRIAPTMTLTILDDER